MKLRSGIFILLFVQVIFASTEPSIFLYEGKGTWDSGIENLETFLNTENLKFEAKSPTDIRNGDLGLENPSLLIIPGGESWVYLEDLKEEGGLNILQYVENGGSYLGICAGAFYATSHRQGGAGNGPYGIGLLEGVAFDGTALEEPGYIEGVMDFKWEMGNPFLNGLGHKVKMLLYGGPALRFTQEEAQKKNIEVLLRFAHTGDPAIIRFQYGKGKVFLAAPHFEVKEEKGEKPMHDFMWPFLRRVVDSLVY